ncbi:MAG: hypothetical protein V4757_16155 [Pseudomonadota bacterium]
MTTASSFAFVLQSLAAGNAAQAQALAGMHVSGRADTAAAWADLACLAMRNGHLAMARHWLLAAHANGPRELAVLEGQCELAWREGDLPGAREWGRAALDAKAALAGAPASGAPPASAHLPQGLQDTVSYSLFGADAWYGESAIQSVAQVRQHYPGWVCAVYVDDAVSAPLRRRLEAAGAQLRQPPPGWQHLPGTVWRFAAIEDPRAGRVLLRDVDSPPTPREAAAVARWIHSGAAAHVMRDHWVHCELVLAGLWGCRAEKLRGIGAALEAWFATPRHGTHADQHFLREWAWPRIAGDMLQHDRCFGWGGAVDFPDALAHDDGHAGSAPSLETLLELTGFAQATGTVAWELADRASGEILGSYTSPLAQGRWSIRLPPADAQHLREGRLQALPVRVSP